MVGRTLSHYRIVEPLGQGGMGVVYRAYDTSLDRCVAIKLLPDYVLADDRARRRFRSEALMLAKVSHPNVEAVYEFGSDSGVDFLVIELLQGCSFESVIRRSPLPESELIAFARQLAAGLSAAHEAGVVHCDLKPANVMVLRDEHLKILDFGLAQLMENLAESTDTVSISEHVQGTIPYMSPEQVEGKHLDGRSDIHALGVMLYELATGCRPFTGANRRELLDNIVRTAPLSPRLINPDLSIELERLILKCLAKDRGDRYDSAAQVASDLAMLAGSGRHEVIALPRPRWRRVASIWGGMLAMVALAVAITLSVFPKNANAEHIRTIAVLPMHNISGDASQEYLSDGLTDELITTLAQVSAIRVISRDSAMRYKGVRRPVPEMARELHADGVLEGSVLRVGERIRVTASLVDGKSDQYLWSRSYERDMKDILALQGELAGQIVGEIRAQMTEAERSHLKNRKVVSPEVYDLYLHGRYAWNTRTPEGLHQASGFFQKALEKDPTFARAYAGLADTYMAMADYGLLRWPDALRQAKQAALRGAELDDNVADIHATLATCSVVDGLDWRHALSEFDRAITLDPSYASAFQWKSLTLALVGRTDEAIVVAKLAAERDPLSPIIATNLGLTYYYAHKYDAAIGAYQKALELDPRFAVAYGYLGLAYAEKHMHPQAIASAKKGVELAPKYPHLRSVLASVYASANEPKKANELIVQLRRDVTDGLLYSVDMAPLYARLHDKDQTFDWLERAYADRSIWATSITADPRFDSVSQDPRMIDLKRRLGL